MYTGTDVVDSEAGTADNAEINDVLRFCRSAITYSPLPLVVAEGLTHIVRYVNPAFCQLVGKEAKELVGLPFALAVPEEEENGCIALLGRVYRTSEHETLADHQHAPALLPGVYWSYVAWPILAAEGHAIAVMVQVADTTNAALFHRQMTTMNQQLLLSSVRQHELREVAEALNVRLQALATTDGLTGLYNHRTFQELLREEVERARRYNAPLSLLFLDVDDFKSYNDTFGHPAGDTVLRRVAEALQATARAGDLVARYGGEEFAVILIETDAASARIAAERFRAAVERVAWQERRITISIGAATLSQAVCDPVTLIGEADTALYRAKQHGRNCVTHSADVHNRHNVVHNHGHKIVHNNEHNIEDMGPAASKHRQPLPSTVSRMQQALNEFRATVEGALEAIGASLQLSQDAMVVCLSRLVESRDEETQEHSLRVAEMMMKLAQSVEMNEEEVLLAKWGALLHDIGKIGILDAILFKPGAFTSEERAVMQRHPALASDMLSTLPFLIGPALDIPRYHHERWDGSGYPHGLKGEAIPLSARLFAVIDVYDALISDRPYRKAWTEHDALQHLRAEMGTHFDPAAVEAFITMIEAQAVAT